MQGILFDLDGTLLDINIDAFLERYFVALSQAVTSLVSSPEEHEGAMRAIHDATGAMMRLHPGETNRETFYRVFESLTAIDLNTEWHVFEEFYHDVFPTLRNGIGPAKGARASLEAARECGLKIAVATNPIFPMSAIEHRMSWAGIQPQDVDAITSYETMLACKPHAEYYRQTCEMIGISPTECLMVGDDRMLDMPASSIGIRTFYVGRDSETPTDYRGDLSALAEALPRLCERRG